MSNTTWIVLGVIAVVVIGLFMIYNGLVAMRQRVSQSFADIDVQLRQRHDLIPNLVETVKGYAAHERGTLEEVVKARNSAVTAQGTGDKVAAENMLSGALGKLFALAEAYPDLKANANFQQLQAELSDIENRRLAPLLQQFGAGIQHRHPAFPGCAARGRHGLYAADVLRSLCRTGDRRTGTAGEVLKGRPWPPSVSTVTSRRTNAVRSR